MNEINIHDLHFSYTPDNEILKGINLSLNGETTAIIGQNGAGKTTFVKLLKGLLKPDKGEIILNGVNTNDVTAAQLAKHIGMVFQNPNDQIFKNKVIDEVMYGPLNIGFDKTEAVQHAMHALQTVGLNGASDKNPYDLSLSERKMISIASILAMDTDIVIFDEPTMGQDFAGKEKIKEIITKLKDKGKLVLCILHDMDFVADVFERTIVFNQGKILLDGSTRNVFSHKEVLEKAYLEQPYVTQLGQQFGLSDVFLTESELVNALRK